MVYRTVHQLENKSCLINFPCELLPKTKYAMVVHMPETQKPLFWLKNNNSILQASNRHTYEVLMSFLPIVIFNPSLLSGLDL